MGTVLGVAGLIFFIVCVIALAATVTWVVVRLSPNPADRKPQSSA